MYRQTGKITTQNSGTVSGRHCTGTRLKTQHRTVVQCQVAIVQAQSRSVIFRSPLYMYSAKNTLQNNVMVLARRHPAYNKDNNVTVLGHYCRSIRTEAPYKKQLYDLRSPAYMYLAENTTQNNVTVLGRHCTGIRLQTPYKATLWSEGLQRLCRITRRREVIALGRRHTYNKGHNNRELNRVR